MLIPWIYYLKEDEQLLVEGFTRRWTVNGPAVFYSQPLWRVKRRKAKTLGPTEYLRLRDTLTGELRNEFGPKLYFPAASEEILEQLSAIPLKSNQYIRLIDKRTGAIRVERGDSSVCLNPTEEILEPVREGVNIDEQTAVLVRDISTGQLELISQPQVFIPAANQEIVERRTPILLQQNQYVKVIDKSAGIMRVERGEKSFYLNPTEEILGRIGEGVNIDEQTAVLVRDISTGQLQLISQPQVFIPAANQEIVERRNPILLQQNQYVKVIDKSAGIMRVERGEKSFYLNPAEEILGRIGEGVNIDEHTAVLVRDTQTGTLELITEPQVFCPGANQEIVEVRQRILLENHETVVIKDRFGDYSIKRGTDAERSFFLQPYEELVEFRWATGLHKDNKNLIFTHIDGRPKFMWYEFEARTQDNVELIISLTFFWQIVDVAAMVQATDDTSGAVCAHVRSLIIQSVSQVSLERFLAGFNAIVRQAVLGVEDSFYAERGVALHAVEVRSVACKDPDTQRILLEIIQETTNRLNRLQKQEGDNDVKLKEIEGEIEVERLKGQLLDLRRQHAQTEALTAGEAEAIRVRAFFEGLGNDMSASEKLAIFNTLRKQDAIAALSEGSAQLYFTPADVDLSIESR
jgi:deoxycytidine triphosphate deaminase